MRNSFRYEKKRGLSIRTKHARTRQLFRALVPAFLLFALIIWLSRPAHVPTHEGSFKSSLRKIGSRDYEEKRSGEQNSGKSAPDGGNGKLVGESPPKISQDSQTLEGRIQSRGMNWSSWQTIEDMDEELCDRNKYPAAWELLSDQITILMNGFAESRVPLLQRNVQMYSAAPIVHSIYILWGNTTTPLNRLKQWSFDSLGAPVYIVRQSSTSLNDRFLPRQYIKTRAVMICDDDITVDSKSLGFALDVWREDTSRIVGFFPRAHAYDLQSKSWIYIKQQGRYSIMLTKLMILSTEYLYLYTCETPYGVKRYVDEAMNCEDIAMNFLVSSRSGKGPLLVEGKARDWGDTRNSDDEQAHSAALSSRKNHRKDRGKCITEFQKLWNGMELRFSYAKASSDLDNEVHCEKFGYSIDCDISVGSKREARRTVGEHVVTFRNRYAYATFLSSYQNVNASLLLAQSLRSSGTIHDLVLLVDPSCTPISKPHVLYDHYDELLTVNISQEVDPWNQHGKLSAWLLLDYARVVYLEVDSLVLANLDHLFQLPEPAAAPRVFMPAKFSTGLLVLKPSRETYTQLVQSLEEKRLLHSRRRQYLLNSYFNGWFQMPAENRLPARYNVPAVFSKQLKPPSWFNLKRAYETMGPLMVVRYGSAKVVSKSYVLNSTSCNVWCAARLKLFEMLLENDLRPLEYDNSSSWAPITLNSSHQVTDLIWPRQVSPGGIAFLPSETSKSREAFVTVLYGGLNPQFSVAGWAETFHYHHASPSRPKTLLLVVSTVDFDDYRVYSTYFDAVRVVEPLVVKGRLVQDSFNLLHLWNQTDFDKLVYVGSTSLFVDNCNSLLDYTPFAAVPSLFPADMFSTHVMSIQPNQQTYDSLREKLIAFEFSTQPVDRFLNAYFSDWYQKSTMHRINPTYRISMVFETHLQSSALPWKVMSFDLDWLPDEEANITRLWKKTVCDIKPAKKPKVVMSLCQSGNAKAL